MKNTKKIKCDIDKEILKSFNKIIKDKGLIKSEIIEDFIKSFVISKTPVKTLSVDAILEKIGNFGPGSLTK